jgi:pentatricopeptide repeat protein
MRRAQDAVRQGNVSYALSTAMAAIALAGPACSVFECNQLLRVLGDSGHVDAMMAIFDAMVAAGAMPTQVTYGTLISRAGACRQPQLASRFYRDMLRRGLEPDAQTLNSLINAYAKAGHVSKAYAAADVMRKRGVSPTLITYNTLLDACARGGNVSLSLAYQTLQQVLAAKLQPNARTFSILIHLCARVGRVDDAFGWFRRHFTVADWQVAAAEAGVQRLLLFGYHGKLIKLAGGIFHTHHHLADGRAEVLTALAALEGLTGPPLEALFAAATVEAALAQLQAADPGLAERLRARLAATIEQRATAYLARHGGGSLAVGAVLFDRSRRVRAAGPIGGPLLAALAELGAAPTPHRA